MNRQLIVAMGWTVDCCRDTPLLHMRRVLRTQGKEFCRHCDSIRNALSCYTGLVSNLNEPFLNPLQTRHAPHRCNDQKNNQICMQQIAERVPKTLNIFFMPNGGQFLGRGGGHGIFFFLLFVWRRCDGGSGRLAAMLGKAQRDGRFIRNFALFVVQLLQKLIWTNCRGENREGRSNVV